MKHTDKKNLQIYLSSSDVLFFEHLKYVNHNDNF